MAGAQRCSTVKGRFTKRSKKSGLPPGSLVHVGEKGRSEMMKVLTIIGTIFIP